ncbi:MAG: signal peptidase II [Chloroflexi bacterium]|nr:signal peptidase II [Chloroflexota bacterium]
MQSQPPTEPKQPLDAPSPVTFSPGQEGEAPLSVNAVAAGSSNGLASGAPLADAPVGAQDAAPLQPQQEAADEGEATPARSRRRAWAYDLYLASLIVLTFLVDQASKTWVRGNLFVGESVPPTGVFRITHTFNTGSAFGLFPNQTFLLMLASIAGIGILLLYFKNQSIPPFWLRTSLGLQLGGAAGNLVDRITLGHVTDFVDVGSWPVFNMADSSIMVGIGILAWFIWRSPKDEAKPKHQETAQADPPAQAAPLTLESSATPDGLAPREGEPSSQPPVGESLEQRPAERNG